MLTAGARTPLGPIAANKAAISKMDKEILVLSKVDQTPKQNDTIENVGMVNEELWRTNP